MSSKKTVFTESQVESALAQSADLIFHPQLFRSMPKITLGLEGEQTETEQPSDEWPGKMASAYARLPILSGFIGACVADALLHLTKNDPKANPAGMKAGEMCRSSRAQVVLAGFIATLVQRPTDARWVGIILFSMLRTFEETIGNVKSAAEMTDTTFAASMMNSAIVSADAWELSFVAKRMLSVPKIEASLRRHIASRVVVALSSMVSVDPDAEFFKGQADSTLH